MHHTAVTMGKQRQTFPILNQSLSEEMEVKCSFDSGSQCNMISKNFVDELGLETYYLVQPSSLAWLQGKCVMRISR